MPMHMQNDYNGFYSQLPAPVHALLQHCNCAVTVLDTLVVASHSGTRGLPKGGRMFCTCMPCASRCTSRIGRMIIMCWQAGQMKGTPAAAAGWPEVA